MAERYYPLRELLAAVNERLAALPDLDQTEFTRRTVYYYVQEGLLPRLPGLRRGPRTRYPAEFIDRLLFIRRLQSEEALSLDHIRQVLAETPPDTVRRVARGEEALRLGRFGAATARPGEQTIRLVAHEMAFEEPPASGTVQESLALDQDEYLDTQEFPAGPRASLRVGGPLTARQRRLLEQAAGLIEALLEDVDD